MENAKERGERLASALIQVIEQARWDARIDSVRQLATRAGMTHTALSARLRGTTPFNARDIGALSVPLGVSPAELVRRAQDLASGPSVELKDTTRPLTIADAPVAQEPD